MRQIVADLASQPIRNLAQNPLNVSMGSWTENAGGNKGWRTTEGGYFYASRSSDGTVNARSGTTPSILLRAVETYTFKLQCRGVKGRSINVRVEWRTGTTPITLLNNLIEATGDWQTWTFTATAPAGTDNTQIWVGLINALTGEEIHLRKVMVVQGTSIPDSYQDGSTPGWRWTGTADASESVGYPDTLESIAGRPAAHYEARNLLGKPWTDDFKRSDGLAGNGWSASVWTLGTTNASPMIAGEKLAFGGTSNLDTRLLVAGTPDVVAECDYTHQSGAYAGICARSSTSNQATIWLRSNQDSGWTLMARAPDGTGGTMGTYSGGSIPSPTNGTTYRLRLECVGDQIRGYVNDVLIGGVFTDTDATRRTNAFVGVQQFNPGGHGNTRFDNFTINGRPPQDTSTVGYWADLSGNGRHLTQGTAASRPLFRSVGVPELLALETRLPTSALTNLFSRGTGVSIAWNNTESAVTVTMPASGVPGSDWGVALGSNASNWYPVTPGETLTFRAQVKTSTSANNLITFFRDAAGSSSGLNAPLSGVVTANGSYQEITLTGTVPAGAAFAQPVVAGKDGQTFHVKNMSLVKSAHRAVTLVGSNPVVSFDGVDDRMGSANNFYINDRTVYMVLRIPVLPPSGSYYLMDSNSGNNNDRGEISLTPSGDFRAWASVAPGTVIANTAIIASATDTVDPLSSTARVASTSNTIYTGAGSERWAGIGLASRSTGNLNALMDVSAVFVYEGVHNNITRQRIEQWLGRQYGITVAP